MNDGSCKKLKKYRLSDKLQIIQQTLFTTFDETSPVLTHNVLIIAA